MTEKIVYPDLETALVRFKARWSVRFAGADRDADIETLVEIHGKDGLFHVLQEYPNGELIEICNSLSSISNLFENPSSVKSDLEAENGH